MGEVSDLQSTQAMQLRAAMVSVVHLHQINSLSDPVGDEEQVKDWHHRNGTVPAQE